MPIVKYLLLFFLFVSVPVASLGQDYYKVPKEGPGVFVSRSQLSYTNMAVQITAGCTDNMQKIKAIYQWICANIAYDTSHRIRTADVCVEKYLGVCQAYCELFYQLANAVGVKVEIINGLSKDENGEVNTKGHSWLFAYTTEDRGILLDPTWGAGGVDKGVFVRNKDPWVWFNVDPEFFILSHWTKDVSCQLVEHPMTEREFRMAMPSNELWLEYDLNVRKIASAARAGTLDLPKFYIGGEGLFSVVDIPMRSSLKIGELYNFRIRPKKDYKLGILNNKTICSQEKWKPEPDGSFSVSFMPRDTGALDIGIRDPSGPDWNLIVKYKIAPPTAADLARVEAYDPLAAPELKRIKGLDAAQWDSAGVDAHKLLKLVREQNVQELPIFSTEKGQRLTIVSVPMNYTLKAGESYTFSFRPRSGVEWVLRNNEQWYSEWQIGDNNLHTQTITPAHGPLWLYVMMPGDDSYWSCLKYQVE